MIYKNTLSHSTKYENFIKHAWCLEYSENFADSFTGCEDGSIAIDRFYFALEQIHNRSLDLKEGDQHYLSREHDEYIMDAYKDYFNKVDVTSDKVIEILDYYFNNINQFG